MTTDLSQELDECAALISAAKISDKTRCHMTNQMTIYALFLSDLDADRLPPETANPQVIASMKEIIGVYCSQIREMLSPAAA
ncbi:hypothetical protein [Pseudomonas sp.]|uniref:hypothetical protein n=1 Tax=Pseudomonas sp. TaxID=306 RepID=UPI00290FBAFF|nr:hypothetical protein [Pseudomonas sp.]MDU4254573.1 hypothetical protein [Pseudomonas sp.]